MAISVFDLFKIGIGPSSSHTVGPMRAARQFVARLEKDGLLATTSRVRSEMYGSLGATGKGHGSDTAVLLGLAGELPDMVDTDAVPDILANIRREKQLKLLGEHAIAFNEADDLILHKRKTLPYHPNGMIFEAFDAEGNSLSKRAYYSVGGGLWWMKPPSRPASPRRASPNSSTSSTAPPNCWRYARNRARASARSCWKTNWPGAARKKYAATCSPSGA
jgi:hypothetical protein